MTSTETENSLVIIAPKKQKDQADSSTTSPASVDGQAPAPVIVEASAEVGDEVACSADGSRIEAVDSAAEGRAPVNAEQAEDALPTDNTIEATDAPTVAAAEVSEATPEVVGKLEARGEEPAAEDIKANGFAALGLGAATLRSLEASGYTTPTPIQAKTIPLILSGGDVLGQAQTGTGKTAAFALPLLERIDLSKKHTQVLVLTPTRELAIQVAEAFEKYAANMAGLRVVPIYGGQDYQIQTRLLNRGVQVVVGTPGRVMDQMRRGNLKLDGLQCLALDEADEMLRMGFVDDVSWILEQTPEGRQITLFSATMPPAIRKIARTYLKDASEVTIEQKAVTASTINQRYVVTSIQHKQAALARILEAEPIDGVLVFVKTRSKTEPLAEFLAKSGLKTAALSGEMAQKQRERIVERLRSGAIDIIIATDVAARGLDVQRISHVINYDLPHDTEAYVHRIGRTGRAGRSGEAILFVQPRERSLLFKIEKATRRKIEPMELPSNREINKQRVARFHDRITEAMGSKELETFRSIVEQYQRNNEVPLELIAASLAVLATGDRPLFMKETLKQAQFATDGGRRRGDDRSRGQKGRARDRQSGPRVPDSDMCSYRIEVGRKHRVKPNNIVGAIANEAGLANGAIGRIKILDQFSFVDLPKSLGDEQLQQLQEIVIAGRKLKLTRAEDSRPRPARQRGDKRGIKKGKGRRKHSSNASF